MFITADSVSAGEPTVGNLRDPLEESSREQEKPEPTVGILRDSSEGNLQGLYHMVGMGRASGRMVASSRDGIYNIIYHCFGCLEMRTADVPMCFSGVPRPWRGLPGLPRTSL